MASSCATGIGKQGVSPGNIEAGNRPLLSAAGRSARADPVRVPVSARRRLCGGPPRRSMTPTEYDRYASSTIAYESARIRPQRQADRVLGHAPPRRRRHQAQRDVPDRSARQRRPRGRGPGASRSTSSVSYSQQLFSARTRPRPICSRHCRPPKPPAMLFTASHGMAFDLGDAQQATSQGALLCQDWPGFGKMKPEHFLSAADVPDGANVNGMVAFLFACFGAGTPDKDQFVSWTSRRPARRRRWRRSRSSRRCRAGCWPIRTAARSP